MGYVVEGYWDPLGEYEDRETKYHLLVITPPRPPPRWLPEFLFRENKPASRVHIIGPPQDQPNFHCFDWRELEEFKTKWVEIKSHLFPPELRCKHISGTEEKKCSHGCYFLEKGGDLARHWGCKREDCEGHALMGRNVKNECGIACFGKKGERLVCIV